jgi:hypothetical protein
MECSEVSFQKEFYDEAIFQAERFAGVICF